MLSARFAAWLVSSMCASQVQTDMNANKPQRGHNGYTQFTKRDYRVPSYVSSTYDALSHLHFVLSSQDPLQVCNPVQMHDFSCSNTESSSFKGGPISGGKITELTQFYIAKAGRAHSYTHHSFALTLLHSGIFLHHPLNSAACGKWRHYLCLPFCALHFLLSTHLTSTMILLFISCWTINIVFPLEFFFILVFFFPCFLCWPVLQLPTLLYLSPNHG